MSRILRLFGIVILILWALSSLATATTDGKPSAKFRKVQNPILSQYIVKLDDSVDPKDVSKLAKTLAGEQGGRIIHTYKHALKGFSVQLAEEAAIALSANPAVDYVEEDGYVSLSVDPGYQTYPTWGLDRIDQRSLPLNNLFYRDGESGFGVNVYVIDTGIRFTHSEFEGRATFGFDAIGDGMNGNDCAGHGTHVAGTIGGQTYGVSKKAKLISVRVFGCPDRKGRTSDVIAGVDWVAGNATLPAVANMSLGGDSSDSLDGAVRKAISKGITVVIAAGNDNANAANYSPAKVTEAITVGATTNNDSRAAYSNWGSVLDVFAPGESITSAGYSNDNGSAVMSGTSMAAPHVSGAAAVYLSVYPLARPSDVANYIVNQATPNVVIDPSSSPNRLLYVQPIGNSALTAQVLTPSTAVSVPCGTSGGSGAGSFEKVGDGITTDPSYASVWSNGYSTLGETPEPTTTCATARFGFGNFTIPITSAKLEIWGSCSSSVGSTWFMAPGATLADMIVSADGGSTWISAPLYCQDDAYQGWQSFAINLNQVKGDKVVVLAHTSAAHLTRIMLLELPPGEMGQPGSANMNINEIRLTGYR